MSLEKLSSEVLQLILRFAHPSAHFGFALASKTLYENSLNVLARHRAAHARFATASDIHALDILPQLLRSAYGSGSDLIEAWHVRELEIWRDRTAWEEWTDWEISREGQISCQTDGSIASPFSSQEQSQLLRNSPWGQDLFLEENGELLADAQRDLKAGRDGFLKMLLIAGLPRLIKVTFVKHGKERPASFIWLSKAIRNGIQTQTWPPGLQSLRKVYAGVAVDPDSENHVVARGGIELARLLRLPNIEEVYFCDLDLVFPEYFDPELYEQDPSHPEAGTKQDKLDYDDYWEMDEILGARKTSALKKLTLDRVASFDHDAREMILGAPISLESFVVRGLKQFRPTYDHPHTRFDRFMTVVSALATYQSTSLQDLVVYDNEYIDGDPRCRLYRPSVLRCFNHLKRASVCLEDMVPMPDCIENTTWSRKVSLSRQGENYAAMVQRFVDTFPPSITALVFCKPRTNVSYTASELDYFQDGLQAMIESGKFASLTDVYIEGIEAATSAFQEAIHSGLRRGVYVHIVASDQTSSYEHPNLPPMPDRSHLKTMYLPGRAFSWPGSSWIPSCGTRRISQDSTYYSTPSPHLSHSARKALPG